MSRNYKFHNHEGIYFVSTSVIDWLDVFTRIEYKEIIIESLKYCQSQKGMEIHAYCIMTNHIHLIFRSMSKSNPPQNILGDFKRFTSKKIVKTILDNPKESRKDLFIEQFKKAAKKSSNVNKYQFWRHDNMPIEIWSNSIIDRKINYIHNNPVVAGCVDCPCDYTYSSARNYAGMEGILDVVCL